MQDSLLYSVYSLLLASESLVSLVVKVIAVVAVAAIAAVVAASDELEQGLDD